MRRDLVRKHSTEIAKGSVADVARKEGTDIAMAFMNVDHVIIVDTSGSMEATDAPGGQSRHDVAEAELRKLQAEYPGNIAVFSFSSDIAFCPDGVPTRFNGGTDMAAALSYVHRLDGTTHFVLISDGEPNDRDKTLDVAREFKSRIDTVYIGPEEHNDFYGSIPGWEHGRDFLKRLSALTGGVSAQSKEIAKLAEPVRLLMGKTK